MCHWEANKAWANSGFESIERRMFRMLQILKNCGKELKKGEASFLYTEVQQEKSATK